MSEMIYNVYAKVDLNAPQGTSFSYHNRNKVIREIRNDNGNFITIRLYHDNGQLRVHCFRSLEQKWHGEAIQYNKHGVVEYHRLFINGDKGTDLNGVIMTEGDKFLLTLEHGVRWLC